MSDSKSEMSTAELAAKVADGDLTGFAGGWMLNRLSQVKVFGKGQLTGANVMDFERVGGANMMHQAPRMSTTTVAGERPLLARQVPSTMRRKHIALHVGESFPEFNIVSSDGTPLTRADLLGKPFIMRLTRTMGSGIVCPACLPGMDDLMHLQERFAELDVNLVVVVCAPQRQAKEMELLLGLNYTLYSDKDFSLFEMFDARFCGGPPMPAWIIADAIGVIRYLWRAENSTLFGMAPHPRGADILKQVQACLA